jgi:hypothetical protein
MHASLLATTACALLAGAGSTSWYFTTRLRLLLLLLPK